MKYGKRPHLSARDLQLLFLIGLAALIVAGVLIGADIQVAGRLSGGGGFYSPWQAARAFLFEHTEPYGEAAARLAQEQAYGRAARVGENRYFLQLPFFLLPVYFPFALLVDAATARGLWLFVNEAALAVTGLLALRLAEWQPPRAFQVGFTLLSVFSLYSVTSLLEGGPAILLGLAYCGILYAYASGQDELAGGLLALTLFAWEIGVFFVLLLVWKSAYDRRWRVWAGFGMALAVLLIVSFLIHSGWVFPFVVATLATLRAPFGTNSAAILERLSPVYGERAAQAMTVLLILLLLYEWSATRRGDERRFVWTGCLTLALTPLIGLRLELHNLVVILPGLALIGAGVANRWRTGYWLAGLLLLVVLLLPWGWFAQWHLLGDGLAHDLLLLFLPAFTALGLYWTRWWFVRPPRTWLDHVRSSARPTQPRPGSRGLPDSTGRGA